MLRITQRTLREQPPSAARRRVSGGGTTQRRVHPAVRGARLFLYLVATMAASRPDSEWSIARFRPTVLVEIDGADDGTFPDDEWVGTKVTVGTALVDVFCPTPRCAMPGRAQAVNGLERDKRVLQALRDVHTNNLGVYANVVETGAVRLGDPVT